MAYHPSDLMFVNSMETDKLPIYYGLNIWLTTFVILGRLQETSLGLLYPKLTVNLPLIAYIKRCWHVFLFRLLSQKVSLQLFHIVL